MSFTAEDLAIVFGVLFGIGEALSLIPRVKSNGIFQLIFNSLKKLAGN